jgi:hypothetical protein
MKLSLLTILFGNQKSFSHSTSPSLFSMRRHKPQPTPIKKIPQEPECHSDELKTFFGVVIFMGNLKYPEIEIY